VDDGEDGVADRDQGSPLAAAPGEPVVAGAEEGLGPGCPDDCFAEGARSMRFPRTISGREALARVEHVLPNLNVPRELLAQLIDVRDGMVHVGFMSSSGIGELLTAFLQFSNELHDELGSEREGQWG
jgi:hypothetical protein